MSESECYIYDYTLSGEIPTDIGNLVELRNLILGLTQLSGEIPNSIGDLVNLTELKIYRSDITGSIPPEIGNLVNLTDLYLKENQLSGIIPDGICNLVENTPNIYLYGNQLCPPYPECLTEEQLNGSWQTGGGEDDQQDTSECIECILGDINNDLILDILDIISTISLILDGDYNECSDLNSDGQLNILDIVTLVNLIFSSP